MVEIIIPSLITLQDKLQRKNLRTLIKFKCIAIKLKNCRNNLIYYALDSSSSKRKVTTTHEMTYLSLN